jgi:ubiquitin carboxyl-terminal hydrolase 10
LADKEGPEIPDSELEKEPQAAEKAELPAPAPAKSAPKLWAGLFAGSSAAAKAPSTGASSPSTTHAAATNGPAESTDNTTGFISSNVKSLAEALRAYRVGNGEKVVFIEPRGLRNTGNMCYMNSVSGLTHPVQPPTLQPGKQEILDPNSQTN